MTKVNNWKSLYVMLSSAINRGIISYYVAPEANVPQHHKCCHRRESRLRVKFCVFMINSAGCSALHCVFEYITGIWFTYLYACVVIIMILLFNVVWIKGKLYVYSYLIQVCESSYNVSEIWSLLLSENMHKSTCIR